MNRTHSNNDAHERRTDGFWKALWKITPAYLFVTGARAALAHDRDRDR